MSRILIFIQQHFFDYLLEISAQGFVLKEDKTGNFWPVIKLYNFKFVFIFKKKIARPFQSMAWTRFEPTVFQIPAHWPLVISY